VAEHLAGGSGPQPVGILDPLPAGQGRVDQRHGLVPGVGGARRAAQVDVLVDQLAEHEPLGQGGGQDETGVGDRVVVVEADRDLIGTVGRSHEQVPSWLGATVVLSTPFSQVSGHLFAVYAAQPQ
jgi:hypothetical protein